MTCKDATNLILHATLIGLLIWEAFTVYNAEKGDTISEVMRSWNSKTGGLMAWAILALWAHWFLPLPPWWTE